MVRSSHVDIVPGIDFGPLLKTSHAKDDNRHFLSQLGARANMLRDGDGARRIDSRADKNQVGTT